MLYSSVCASSCEGMFDTRILLRNTQRSMSVSLDTASWSLLDELHLVIGEGTVQIISLRQDEGKIAVYFILCHVYAC